MGVYKIFPEKDASLYSQYPDQNTGLDQILEASTYQSNGEAHASRYLVKFSTNEIQEVYANKITNNNFKVYFKNYAAVVTGLNLERTLELYPASGSWGMGTGRFNDDPNPENGVSWDWRTYQGLNAWTTPGGDYHLTPTQTQTFTYADTKDVNVDVTETVDSWYANSLDSNNGIVNDGFIVKQPDASEFVNNVNNNAVFRFFSIDTHTIYPPYLEFKYDDYTFDVGSSTNTVLGTPEAFISIYNNRGSYYRNSRPRLRFAAMPKYPDQVFATASLYTTNFYLPESQSLYAVKDTETNEFVIDFDEDYTRISADAISSYFDLECKGLEPQRNYTVLVKTVIDGDTLIYDEDIRFKIVNG